MANLTFLPSQDGLLRCNRKLEYRIGLKEILLGYLHAINGNNEVVKATNAKAPLITGMSSKVRKPKVNTRILFISIESLLRSEGELYFDTVNLDPKDFDAVDIEVIRGMFPDLQAELDDFFAVAMDEDLTETNSGLDLAA